MSDVSLQIWTPVGATIEMVKQFGAEILNLTAKVHDGPKPRTKRLPTGNWGEERRDFHVVKLESAAVGKVGDTKLCARVSLVYSENGQEAESKLNEMAFTCPDGHDSTASDFCSECGLQMPAPVQDDASQGTSVDVTSNAQPVSRESCPRCKTDRDDPSTPFCGVCGYNFVTGQGGDIVAQTVTAPQPVMQPIEATPAAAAAPIEIEVSFDESNVEAPQGMPPHKFSLYDEESLIGRRSSSMLQTVRLDGDDCVSRRHLLLIRQSAGSYVARLFDNTNGGLRNGKEMTAGVEEPLAEGDTIAVGAFTIIKVNVIRGSRR